MMVPIVAAVGIFFILALVANANAKTPQNFSAKVDLLSRATAFAEGFMDRSGKVLTNNVPARFNNPGDLGPGDAPGFTSQSKDGSQVVQFPDASTGWRYLNNKWYKILAGNSKVFTLDMTITQVAQRYAADWRNWANNFSSYLGVSTEMTLRQWRDS